MNRFLAAILCFAVTTPVWASVTLNADQRENLGIETEAFRVIPIAKQWPASGQVLDGSTLIAALGELRTAELTASASRAEASRAELLYQDDRNIARKALEAARIQASTDDTRVATLKGQLLATWGRGIADMPAAPRAGLSKDLLAGRVSLVRADQLYALQAGVQIKTARVAALDGKESWSAQWLGPLPQGASGPGSSSQSTAATLGGAALLRVPAALPVGQLLTVSLIGAGDVSQGPSAPAAAVIRWRGAEWIYEEIRTNVFERRAVQPGPRVEGRVLLTGSAAPKGKVVVVGARALLGAELGASVAQDSDEAE